MEPQLILSRRIIDIRLELHFCHTCLNTTAVNPNMQHDITHFWVFIVSSDKNSSGVTGGSPNCGASNDEYGLPRHRAWS